MAKQIVIIQGHPDPGGNHFCHALASAYADGAESAGHQVNLIDVAQIEFPLIRSKTEFDLGQVPESIRQAQQVIQSAEHLVIFYPLWLGTMPAYFKAFLEQVFRPGFAAQETAKGQPWKKLLTGKTARVVITMGMPAFIYRWYYLAHSLRSLERNILGFCGIGPVKDTLIGMVDAIDATERKKWLSKMHRFGSDGC
jgi:putative NADPH-quinone reductase